jgi:glutamine amidotransferase-like uncharacterized protein
MSGRVAYIYAGEGTGPWCREWLRTALESALADETAVRFLGADDLIRGDWCRSAVLLAIPGGEDEPYAARLNGRGNAVIRGFVEGGGVYLGVCAGAYYGAAFVDWVPPGGGRAIRGPRELAFAPVTAAGPLAVEGQAGGRLGEYPACAAALRGTASFAPRLGGESCTALYWCGPSLGGDATPVLSYDSGETAGAVLVGRVGHGAAILCSPHLEADSTAVASVGTPAALALAAALRSDDAKRRRLFSEILAQAGVPVRPNQPSS